MEPSIWMILSKVNYCTSRQTPEKSTRYVRGDVGGGGGSQATVFSLTLVFLILESQKKMLNLKIQS